jgi:hypothetical protein
MLLKDGCDTVIHEHRKALTEILFLPQNISGEDGVVRCHVTPYESSGKFRYYPVWREQPIYEAPKLLVDKERDM